MKKKINKSDSVEDSQYSDDEDDESLMSECQHF